jgi:phage terminase large subunit-like protein
LDDFRSLSELRAAAEQAKALPARELAFRLLYLNQAVDASARFLNRRDWDACAVKPEAGGTLFGGQLELSRQRCILGLDLSSTTDLTALAAWFPATCDLRVWFWMPADNLEEAERRDIAPYRLWARQGYIEATPGRAIDKAFIVHRLGGLMKEFDVQFCAADRWRLDELERLAAEEGLNIDIREFGMGWRDMGPAIDAFETAVLRKELRHPGHPVLDMCMANAVTVSDPTGARKLVKAKQTGRIDGLVAAVIAVGSAVKVAPKKGKHLRY